jgi:predicted nucleic acid-binding protein
MDDKRLVADSTFYSFFVSDTNEKKCLGRILKRFIAEMPPVVYRELKKSEHPEFLDEFKDKINVHDSLNLHLSELLKPLFSKEEREKGEHEVIVIAFFCYNLRLDFFLILDDSGGINFVKQNLNKLAPMIKRTAGFIGDCCVEYKIFNKTEALDLLNKMDKSKFYIDEESLNKIKRRVLENG